MTFGAGDALDLLDWKRQVFRLYEQIRANPDGRQPVVRVRQLVDLSARAG